MKKQIVTFVFLALVGLTLASTSIFAQEAAPKLEIVAPKEGQTFYGSRVPVLFVVEDFTLIDPQGQKPLAGQGHILAWLDETNPTLENATKITSDSFTFADVGYGEHTLKTELVTSDNKSLAPVIALNTSFKTEALPSASEPAETSFDKKTTVVILIIVALVIVAAWWYTKDEDLDEEPKQAKTKKTVKKAKRTKKKK